MRGLCMTKFAKLILFQSTSQLGFIFMREVSNLFACTALKLDHVVLGHIRKLNFKAEISILPILFFVK